MTPILQSISRLPDTWKLFPVNGKVPLTTHGVHDATNDQTQLQTWFRDHPERGWALATGEPSGVFVVDLDGPEARAAIAKLGRLPRTPIARTKRGYHWFLKMPEGHDIRNSASRVAKGVDIRGTGGYVVLPPSPHPDGGNYRWQPGFSPDRVPVAEAPQWLLDALGTAGKETNVVEEEIGEGQRETTLTSIAGSMRRRGMTADEIHIALTAVNQNRCSPPLEDEAIERIAHSVARYTPEPTPIKVEFGPEAETIAYADTWVVASVVDWLAERMQFVPETGHAYVWNGHVWETDRKRIHEHLTQIRLIWLSNVVLEQAQSAEDEDDRKKIYSLAAKIQSRSTLTKTLDSLQAHPRMTRCVEDFDSNQWELNTPDGIVDLRTGAQRPSDPTALHSRATQVGVSRDRQPVTWLRFLDELTAGDDELQGYLQRLAGYALTGSTQEQIVAFIHGPPLTGKTVFTDTLAKVLGGYHQTASTDTFAASNSDRHPVDLADLAGARLVTALETQEGRSWDGQRIKLLSGGDMVKARFMRQNFFTYQPRYQIIIAGNHEPEIRGGDAAVLRRLHVIPFEHTPPKVDKLLPEKLVGEYGAILAWAIDGCLAWQAQGLAAPEAVASRTDRYKQEEDVVGAFLDECCAVDDPTAQTTRQQLFNAWKIWCHERGEEPGTLKQLRRRFQGHARTLGFEETRIFDGSQHKRGYKGLQITQDTGVFS